MTCHDHYQELLLQYDDAPVDFAPVGFPQKKREIYGNKVGVVLAEVVNDSNIQYLNPDDDEEEGGGELNAPVFTHLC